MFVACETVDTRGPSWEMDLRQFLFGRSKRSLNDRKDRISITFDT
jgi:hypothetical protein